MTAPRAIDPSSPFHAVETPHAPSAHAIGTGEPIDSGRNCIDVKGATSTWQKSDAELRAFFESAAVGALLLNPATGQILRASTRVARLLGYSTEQLSTMTIPELLLAGDVVSTVGMLDRLARGELKEFIHDQQLCRKDGDLVWVNLTVFPLKQEGGSVHTAAVMVHDISPRKNGEQELSQLRKRLTANLAAMTRLHALGSHVTPTAELPSFLTELLDATIAMQRASSGVIQLYERQGGTLSVIAHRGLAPACLEQFRTVRTFDPFSCARAFHTRTRVIVEDTLADPQCATLKLLAANAGIRALQSTPLFDHAGEPLGVLTTHFCEPHQLSEHELKLTDLYARQAAEFIGFKQSENALRESEGRLAAIFDHAPAGLSEATLEGDFLSVNDELCRMLGRTREELLTVRAVEVTHPDDAECSLAACAQLLETGESVSLDKRYLRPDGTIVWANAMLTLLNDQSGQPCAILGVITDLTARKQTERALMESESRFRTLAEASPAMIWFLDANGCHRFANRQFLVFFGKTEEEIFGQDWRRLLHPGDSDAFTAEVQSCIRERRPLRRQARVLRRDGQWRWTESHALPHFGEDGRYLGHVGHSLDITDSLEATKKLRDNQRQLAVNLSGMTRLQELSTRLVRAGDLHSLLTEILAASADLMGGGKGTIELYDQQLDHLDIVVHQGLRADFISHFGLRRCAATRKALQDGARVIVEDLHDDPSLRDSVDLNVFAAEDIRALQCTPLISRDGRLLGMLTNHFRTPRRPAEHELRFLDLLARMAADFIERSESEKALREGEEKLRRAIEIETVGIIFFNTSGLITSSNESFLRMSGYSREDLVNGIVRWEDMTPREWIPHSLKAVEEFRALGRTVPYEKQYIRKDGSRWWGLVSATRFDQKNGVEFIIDITARKLADEELRRHRDDLEIGVQERTAALDAVNGALRDEIVERQRAEAARQELQRQLASAQEDERRRISRELHDQVGQHVTALMLGLKSLDSTVLEPTTAATLATLQGITERIGKEIHDIALELRPTALDDLGLLRTLSNYIEQWSAQSKIAVDFHSSGWTGERLPPPIETTVYRIVQEALTNIAKHAHANRVSLIIDRRPDQVTVIIEDDGNGFDPEAVARNPQNKSLGLLGMKERAALMDGDVKIESGPGKGTTIFVRVPVPVPSSPNPHG